MKKYIFFFLAALLVTVSCTEHIDESARYVYKDRSISGYLQTHDQYSEYVQLLKTVHLSIISETTVFQLLTARGNYTCFAPTNDAIHDYLDSLVADGLINEPSWDAFTDSVKLDSIQKVIVYNSIIDGGDEKENVYEISFFPTTSNAEFPLANMNYRKLTVQYIDKEESDIFINGKYAIDKKNRDIPALNGVIHAMHQVIAPTDATLADYLQKVLDTQEDGYLVMARVLQACKLLDTLRVSRDEVYEMKKIKGEISQVYDYYTESFFDTPEHRSIGYTIFAETDDFWRSQGIDPSDPNLLNQLTQWILDNHEYSELDHFETDDNYQSEDNLLYQWVTYHILPFKISAGKLSIHENEFGYSWANPGILGIPVMDYYTTMGKRRLMKLIESSVSDGVCINRFPTTDNGRHGTGMEISCDPDKVGVLIERESNRVVTDEVKNGCIFPVNSPVSYNDKVRQNLSSERIRFDVAGIFPELITNDIRNHGPACPGSTVAMPYEQEYQYLTGLYQNEQNVFCYWNCYHAGFTNLKDDEIKCTGRFDVTIMLPPVPRLTTYEIRYKVLATFRRGIVQVYFGTDPENLYTPDIPQDLTKSLEDYEGYEQDTGIDDYDADVDRALRNQGVMKGAQSIICKDGTERTAYGYNTRRIIVREQLDPDKTYYLRFRSVLEGTSKELCLDYLEFCPKEVYDNPSTPEDIW